MFVYLFIALGLMLLYIPLSMMWSGSRTGVCDDSDDDQLRKIDTIEDAFRFNRAGGDMSTDGMGDRPLE